MGRGLLSTSSCLLYKITLSKPPFSATFQQFLPLPLIKSNISLFKPISLSYSQCSYPIISYIYLFVKRFFSEFTTFLLYPLYIISYKFNNFLYRITLKYFFHISIVINFYFPTIIIIFRP